MRRPFRQSMLACRRKARRKQMGVRRRVPCELRRRLEYRGVIRRHRTFDRRALIQGKLYQRRTMRRFHQTLVARRTLQNRMMLRWSVRRRQPI